MQEKSKYGKDESQALPRGVFRKKYNYRDDRDLDAFTDHMCDAAGKRLDEDQQAAAVEALLEGTDPGATIQFAQSRIPLAPIHAGEVAARFGLVREPKEP